MNQLELAVWAQKEFNLEKVPSQSTISENLKRKIDPHADKNAKKKINLQSAKLDKLLIDSIMDLTSKRIAVSDALIRELAGNIGTKLTATDPSCKMPKFSQGWLSKFKSRHGLRMIRMHGEAASVDADTLSTALDPIVKLIQDYPPENVYNMDETGFFYRMAPGKTIAQRQIAGSKKDKTRITVAFTCNATGKKVYFNL